MWHAELIRSTAAFQLATLGVLAAPLRILARSPDASGEERDALQQEVWAQWQSQPAPLNQVLFD